MFDLIVTIKRNSQKLMFSLMHQHAHNIKSDKLFSAFHKKLFLINSLQISLGTFAFYIWWSSCKCMQALTLIMITCEIKKLFAGGRVIITNAQNHYRSDTSGLDKVEIFIIR